MLTKAGCYLTRTLKYTVPLWRLTYAIKSRLLFDNPSVNTMSKKACCNLENPWVCQDVDSCVTQWQLMGSLMIITWHEHGESDLVLLVNMKGANHAYPWSQNPWYNHFGWVVKCSMLGGACSKCTTGKQEGMISRLSSSPQRLHSRVDTDLLAESGSAINCHHRWCWFLIWVSQIRVCTK